jgi:hypothetical protein
MPGYQQYPSAQSQIDEAIQRTGVLPDGTPAYQVYQSYLQTWEIQREKMLLGSSSYIVNGRLATREQEALINAHRLMQDSLLLAKIVDSNRTLYMFEGLDLERYE